MNPVLDQIKAHRSIRRYKADPIEPEKLERILQTGIRASSSGNMQAYSIIVTRSPELRQRLYEPHMEQDMVLEAPLLLTFCADFHRMRRWLKLRGAPDNFNNFMSFMIASVDAILVAQTVAIAAEAEGLGLCYLGSTLANSHEIARILECPENVVPVVGYTLGYAAEAPAPRDRLPLGALVHTETYSRLDDDGILATYSEREVQGWNRYMSHPELRRKVLEAGADNLAQVYTRVKYTRESHEDFSRNLLKTLESREFL